MTVAVLTVDQRSSRTGDDLVPAALDDPAALPRVVEALLRQDAWNIGIGVGPVDLPLAASARAGRGTAYLHARDAVTASKNSPWHLRVAGREPQARALETTLWLWAAVLGRRTARGWAVADLVDEGLTYEQAGHRLGISASAVSQRAQAAGIVEGRRARELATRLTADLLASDLPADLPGDLAGDLPGADA